MERANPSEALVSSHTTRCRGGKWAGGTNSLFYAMLLSSVICAQLYSATDANRV